MNSDGGFLVPKEFEQSILDLREKYGRVVLRARPLTVPVRVTQELLDDCCVSNRLDVPVRKRKKSRLSKWQQRVRMK